MDKTNGQTKKCFCARCFLPIDIEDKVDIENQNFHRICSMCSCDCVCSIGICRTIPSCLKMFYGHVFCGDCFKNHVMTRFKGEGPRMQSNSWWMQWAPDSRPQEACEHKDEEITTPDNAEEPPKRHICARCLQIVHEDGKIDIAGQSFHTHCAKCYFCHTVPTSQPKIYYGQLFCEECFHRHVLSRNRDNPSEFFRTCFEQWQSNPQFADNMREFMAGGSNTPFVFMMQGQQPPFCRCGTNPRDSSWIQSNEPKKSATAGTLSIGEDSVATWDLFYENRTEVTEVLESCNDDFEMAAEKIEKLTKYLHARDCHGMKKMRHWKISDSDKMPDFSGKRLVCPKCLWQCGPIYVNGEYIKVPVFE